jgi:CRP-like cAMP-binding protein
VTSSDHPLTLLIRKLAQHSPLPQADRDAILALPYTLRSLEPHAYTIREGDVPLQCGVLVSGFAYRQKTTSEGARQIIALHIPGDPLDFQNLFLDEADHSLQMLTRGDVAIIARSHFQELARSHPAIAHAIFVDILIDSAIFREWVLNVGRRDSRARLAHVLCEFAVRLERQGLAETYGYELPMTQEQLGDALGLTAVHVNRTLKQLEVEGYIVRQKRKVSFPNWMQMRQLADFNQRYLHLDRQKSGVELV